MVSEEEKRAIVRRLARKTVQLVKMTLNVLDHSIWRGNQPIERFQSSSLYIRLGNQLTIFDNVLDAALVEMEVEQDQRSRHFLGAVCRRIFCECMGITAKLLQIAPAEVFRRAD